MEREFAPVFEKIGGWPFMTITPGLTFSEPALADICRRYQIKELSVFGSVARGEMRPDSDVDLLVEFLAESKPGLLKYGAVQTEMEALLGRRVDLVPKQGLKKLIRDGVLSEARPLYEA